jgi:predicted HNH restriction endonuclease
MDGQAEERQKIIDEKFATLKANLAKEKGEFKQHAEELEVRSNAMREVARKNIHELEKPITPQEMALASQSAWALAQTFRLGERLTTELEWLYEAHYQTTKNMIQLQRDLPDLIHIDAEKLIANYEKGLDAHLAEMVKDATKHVITGLFEPKDEFERKREERNDP